MKTLRHYFLTDSLEAVESVEKQLTDHGVSHLQLHVLTNNEAEAQQRDLSLVSSLLRRDTVESTLVGAMVGSMAAALVLFVTGVLDLPGPTIGWVPYVFLAIVAFGFCTWEGGLYGIQQPNRVVAQFSDVLKRDRHVFFVDLAPEDKQILLTAMEDNPALKLEQLEVGKSRWIIRFAESLVTFIDRNLFSRSQLDR